MPEEHLNEDERQKIISCVRSGSKIEAIKIYREATGADLAESKHVIETLAAKISGDAPPLTETGEDEVAALLTQGNKIAAIKLYREKTGAGLKEAKDKVEALAESLDIAEAPVAKNKASGCGTSVVLSVAFVVVVFTALSTLQRETYDATELDSTQPTSFTPFRHLKIAEGPACPDRIAL